MDSYPAPSTPSKAKPQRRNPFSGDADDMGSAGAYRTSAPAASRRDDESTGYQSQSRGGTGRTSSPANQSPSTQQTGRANSQCEYI